MKSTFTSSYLSTLQDLKGHLNWASLSLLAALLVSLGFEKDCYSQS